jgi:hypothetical protein
MLQHAFQEIFAELYPYYTNPDIIGMARFDAYKNPDIASLENAMYVIFNQLIISRNNYLNTLNK